MSLTVRCLISGGVISLLFVVGLASPSVNLQLVEAAKNQDWETVGSLLEKNVDVNGAQPDGTAALAWAAYWDNLETVERLIGAGADLNAANDYGVTPLSLACTNRNPATVQELLRAGADPNAPLWNGETLLMTAARTGTVDVVELLLAYGADLNAKEPRRGQTALMWAISFGNPDIAEVLIEHGADVRARTKQLELDGFTPMVLVGFAADVEATPMGSYTPLLFAARVGDLASARLLLARGADVNEATEDAGSALVIASAGGHEELALFLLEQGADPNATDVNGISSLHYALRDGIKVLHDMDITRVVRICGVGAAARCRVVEDPDPAMLTDPALSYTLQIGGNDPFLPGPNMSELAKALLGGGADPNAQLTHPPPQLRLHYNPTLSLAGATPFFLAAAAADLPSMRMLVEGGAEPLMSTVADERQLFNKGHGDDNQVQGNGTPLMVTVGMGRNDDFTEAAEERALESAQVLLNLGADVNAATETGWTPLHAAAFVGADTLVEFLVENGAKLDVQNGCGQTPLSLAAGTDSKGLLQRASAHDSTAELLRKLGAGTTPLSGPVGQCVLGRFGLDYYVNP